MSAYTVYLFDDSCHLFTTTDLGLTYTISTTLTSAGEWTDLQMAPNDGDAQTCVAFDAEYNGLPNESALNITRNAGGLWTFINPTGPTSDGTAAHHQTFFSGAVSGSAGVILALPSNWVDSTLSYPRISINGGVTWGDITGLGTGRFWSRAAINKGASILYMTSTSQSTGGTLFLSKSTNSGVTWADVTAPPTGTANPNTENNSQLVCSAAGTKVLFVSTWDQFIYLSNNSGSTWSQIAPPVPGGTNQTNFANGGSGFSSCGMSPDGASLIVCFSGVQGNGSYPYQSYVATSVDSGATWTFQTPPSVTAQLWAMKAAVSANDLAFAVGFQNFGTDTIYKLDTVISGGSWQTNPITPVDILGLNITSMYMFGPTSPPPPPSGSVPYPGNPQTPYSPTSPQPIPSLFMRYSNDGGHTWSNYRPKGLV
jgi:hypothetical protein